MKPRLCMLSALLAVVLVSGMAWGYPTRFGAATGLVDLPTADVAMSGGAELAGDYTRLENGQQIWPVRLLIGASAGAEVGFVYAKLKDGINDNATGFGAKMALMEEPTADYGVGVGASFLNLPDVDMLNIYAVLTKEFTVAAPQARRSEAPRPRVRGHLGVMFTRITDGADDDEVQPFLGVDITSPEGTSFVVEYKPTKFGDDYAAAAIRYPLSPKVTAQVGVARSGTVLGQDDYRFFVGFNYNFAVTDEEGAVY